MANILIVDDEPLVRTSLRKLVDWENNGFTIVGETYNGEEAMNLIMTHNVDIVITDLVMPVMDGISLIKKIRAEGLSISIIVLSSYNEFHLVRNAFFLGACDYIVKSEIDPNNIIKSCKLAAMKGCEGIDIISENKFVNQTVDTEETQDQNQQIIKEIFLKKIILEDYDFSSIIKAEKLGLNLRLRHGVFVIMQICIDCLGMRSTDSLMNKKTLSDVAAKAIEAVLLKNKTGDSFNINPDLYAIVCSFPCDFTASDIQRYCYAIFIDIKESLSRIIPAEVCGGMSEPVSELRLLKDAFSQAEKATQYCFVSGRGHLTSYKEIPYKSSESVKMRIDHLAKLKDILESMDQNTIKNAYTLFEMPDSGIAHQDLALVRDVFIKYYFIFQEFTDKYEISKNCINVIDSFNHIQNNGTLSELNQWLKQVLDNVACSITDNVCNLACSYIQKHYSENISLRNIASSIHISEGYLCTHFLKVTGKNITAYLNEFRVEKAKELLKSSNNRIYEISQSVGFNSVEHFSRTFKRIVGCSPVSWR